ncbi:DUF1365 domain-containing protein [Coraliomargarita sp. W4R53]
MTTHSQIYRGKVVHQRLGPSPHAFTYPATFFGFDLSQLDQLEASSSLFSHNRANILSLHDHDYLYGQSQPILQQLDALIPQEAPDERTILISSPRYIGYAFNPVNFHLRLRGNQLICVVAEVNNTFKDRHVYPLHTLTQSAPHCWTAACPKAFHVSPFNNSEGDYKFTFQIKNNKIFLGVDLYQHDQCVIKTWIQGYGQPVTNRSIFNYALRHPCDTALNSMPRILWQAAQLYYRKKLKIHQRPSPESKHTLINRDKVKDPRPIV